MIYDILEVFEKLYEDKGDELILGSYSLKDGLYVKINKDATLEFYEAKTVKKEKVFNSLDGILNSEIQEWFKQRDYWSNVVETAKSYDVPIKSIHNNNYLTLFMKSESLCKVEKKHLRDKLFLTVLNFQKFSNKEDKEILEQYKKEIQKLSRQKDIVKKYYVLMSKLNEIIEKIKELEIKNYIKIFFDEDINLYKKESEIYLSLKVFNKNDFNQIIENEIYGLSNANIGLNSKKPYLENKTKKLNIPFMLKNGDSLMLKKFFDWLKVQPNHQNRTLDEEHFFMQKHSKNDEAEIIVS